MLRIASNQLDPAGRGGSAPPHLSLGWGREDPGLQKLPEPAAAACPVSACQLQLVWPVHRVPVPRSGAPAAGCHLLSHEFSLRGGVKIPFILSTVTPAGASYQNITPPSGSSPPGVQRLTRQLGV